MMSPLTSWLLIVLVGVPWTVGVTVMVRTVGRWADRMNRDEPLYVDEGTLDRLGGRR